MDGLSSPFSSITGIGLEEKALARQAHEEVDIESVQQPWGDMAMGPRQGTAFVTCGPQKIHPHAKSLVANQQWTTTHPPATIVEDGTLRLREASRRWQHSHTGSAI
jgi:hypothetical protein